MLPFPWTADLLENATPMSWLRFDDTFPDHPKILCAGILAPLVTCLQVRAVAYAARYLTNGAVPDGAILPMVRDMEMLKSGVDWKQLMIDLRLWELKANGIIIHDYLDYNPTRKKVLSDRKQRKLAGQAGGEANRKRLASHPASHPGLTFPKQKGAGPELAPVPIPNPKDQDHLTPTPFPSGNGFLELRCSYCGATPGQTGRAHEMDHFLPVMAGGTDDPSNLLPACHVCNQAKSGRIFKTIEEAQDWLHRAYWSSRRQRWTKHRAIAFGGKPPSDYNPRAGEPTADQVLGLPSGPRRDPGLVDQELLDRAREDYAKRFPEPEGAA